MEDTSNGMVNLLDDKEREVVRSSFRKQFGRTPELADGVYLRRWRGGDRAGQPKIPPAVQAMLDRGLVEVFDGENVLCAVARFTEPGLEAIRRTARTNSRFLPVRDYGDVLRELGFAP